MIEYILAARLVIWEGGSLYVWFASKSSSNSEENPVDIFVSNFFKYSSNFYFSYSIEIKVFVPVVDIEYKGS